MLMDLEEIHLTTGQWRLEWVCARQSHLWEWKHQKRNGRSGERVKPPQRTHMETPGEDGGCGVVLGEYSVARCLRELLCFVGVMGEWEKHSYDQERLLASWSLSVSLMSPALPLVFICTAPLQSLVLHWFTPAGDCPVASSLHEMEAESPPATDVMTWDADFICCCSAVRHTSLPKMLPTASSLNSKQKIKPPSPQPDSSNRWTILGRAFWALETAHLTWGMSGRLEVDQVVWVWKWATAVGTLSKKLVAGLLITLVHHHF